MKALEESLSQVSLQCANAEDNEAKAAERAARTWWVNGSKLEVYSNSTKSWHEGTVVGLLRHKPSSLHPTNAQNLAQIPDVLLPILSINYQKDNVTWSKYINRNLYHLVRPTSNEIKRYQ
eukprot:948457_1